MKKKKGGKRFTRKVKGPHGRTVYRDPKTGLFTKKASGKRKGRARRRRHAASAEPRETTMARKKKKTGRKTRRRAHAAAAPRRRRRKASTAPRRRRRRAAVAAAPRRRRRSHRRRAHAAEPRRRRRSHHRRSHAAAPRRRRSHHRRHHHLRNPLSGGELALAVLTGSAGWALTDFLDRWMANKELGASGSALATGQTGLSTDIAVLTKPGLWRILAQGGMVALPALVAFFSKSSAVRAGFQGAAIGAGVHLGGQVWNHYVMAKYFGSSAPTAGTFSATINQMYTPEMVADNASDQATTGTAGTLSATTGGGTTFTISGVPSGRGVGRALGAASGIRAHRTPVAVQPIGVGGCGQPIGVPPMGEEPGTESCGEGNSQQEFPPPGQRQQPQQPTSGQPQPIGGPWVPPSGGSNGSWGGPPSGGGNGSWGGPPSGGGNGTQAPGPQGGGNGTTSSGGAPGPQPTGLAGAPFGASAGIGADPWAHLRRDGMH